MIKMYVLKTCPDCEYVEKQVEGNIEATMEQIKRIKKMEERLNRSSQVVGRLSSALDDYIETLEDIRALESYYGCEEWKKDFADEEANRLPKDLKRGVLSEDGIWNLLEDHRNLKARMEECL